MISADVAKPSGAREIFATRAVFFAAGATMACWGPLVAFAQKRLGLDERGLGLLLLCLGLGSIAVMPFSGGFASRYGCRKTIFVAGAAAAVALPFLAVLSNVPAMAVALALFGAGVGTVDVVMNIQATVVERESGRAMMSGFHGLYSVGGIAGAGGATALLSAGVTPVGAACAIVALSVVVLLSGRNGLLQNGGDADAPPFAFPRGVVVLIGVMCFVLFLAEGAMLDWSGVFLTEDRGVAPERAGFGYVAFATLMTIGRLTGDRLVGAIGPRRTLLFGPAISAAGLLVACVVPAWWAALLGFAMVGAGAANSVPVLFSAAGRQTAMPENLALSAVTTMGYGGLLIGPAAIGFVARETSLAISFALVAAALIAVALTAPRTVRTG